MTQDVYELVQNAANMTHFNEYLVNRRRALLGQAKALDAQRAAILQEAEWIAKVTGPKFVKTQENQ